MLGHRLRHWPNINPSQGHVLATAFKKTSDIVIDLFKSSLKSFLHQAHSPARTYRSLNPTVFKFWANDSDIGPALVECQAALFCVPDWRPCVDFQPVIWTHCATQKPPLMSGQALSRSCRDHTRDAGTVLVVCLCPGRTLSVQLMKTSSPIHLLSAAPPFQFQINMERSVVIGDGDARHDPCRLIHVAWFHYVFQTERYLLVCSCHGLFGFHISVPSALSSTWSNVVIGHRNHFRHVMWEACKLGPGT